MISEFEQSILLLLMSHDRECSESIYAVIIVLYMYMYMYCMYTSNALVFLYMQYDMFGNVAFLVLCRDLVLDFGPSNPLGHPEELYITVTNSSAITTTLSMAIQHYKSHLEQDSMNVIETSSTVNRYYRIAPNFGG